MQTHPAEGSWSDYALPDARGHFGPYGGVFVAETLRQALDELAAAYEKFRVDPQFQEELRWELEHYVGRPSPIYHCRSLSPQALSPQSSPRLVPADYASKPRHVRPSFTSK